MEDAKDVKGSCPQECAPKPEVSVPKEDHSHSANPTRQHMNETANSEIQEPSIKSDGAGNISKTASVQSAVPTVQQEASPKLVEDLKSLEPPTALSETSSSSILDAMNQPNNTTDAPTEEHDDSPLLTMNSNPASLKEENLKESSDHIQSDSLRGEKK